MRKSSGQAWATFPVLKKPPRPSWAPPLWSHLTLISSQRPHLHRPCELGKWVSNTWSLWDTFKTQYYPRAENTQESSLSQCLEGSYWHSLIRVLGHRELCSQLQMLILTDLLESCTGNNCAFMFHKQILIGEQNLISFSCFARTLIFSCSFLLPVFLNSKGAECIYRNIEFVVTEKSCMSGSSAQKENKTSASMSFRSPAEVRNYQHYFSFFHFHFLKTFHGRWSFQIFPWECHKLML